MDRREGPGRGHGEGRPMRSNYFLPKPVKVGDVIEATIEATASRGDGIAKKDGFVIFVKGAKQGETIKVRITEVRARFALGEKVEGDASASPQPEEPSDSSDETEEQ